MKKPSPPKHQPRHGKKPVKPHKPAKPKAQHPFHPGILRGALRKPKGKDHHPQHRHQEHPHGPVGKKRGLTLNEDLPVCTAQALATSLWLAGGRASAKSILALHRACSDGDGEGVPIATALDAAAGNGLGGYRLASYGMADPADDDGPLILGVDLPGKHTVVATSEGWWSWGELYNPDHWPNAVVEEAWVAKWQI